MTRETFIPLSDVARDHGRHPDTIRRWCARRGLALYRSPAGTYTMAADDVPLLQQKVTQRTNAPLPFIGRRDSPAEIMEKLFR